MLRCLTSDPATAIRDCEQLRRTDYVGGIGCALIATKALLLAVICVAAAEAQVCRDVSSDEGQRLARYVAQRYHLRPDAALHLERQEHVSEDCYRKLLFSGDGVLGRYHLTLYASPDLRFLSTDLFDSLSDPDLDERKEAVRKITELLPGEYASTGSAAPLVTVVLFSDFQCPYCKRMQALLRKEPLISSAGGVRLLFRHMPALAHSWAQKAAEAAACAQLQNTSAFWQLHDSLFQNQASITAENIDQEVDLLALRIEALSIGDFRDCLHSQASLGIVLRDRQLGVAIGVKGTPTFFVDGELLSGLPDADEFHRRLARAVEAERLKEHVGGADQAAGKT